MESRSVIDNLQIQIKKNHCEPTVENFISAAHKKRKKNTVDSICMHLHISQKQNSIYTYSVRNVGMKSCRRSIDMTKYWVNYTRHNPITDSNYCWKTDYNSYEWKNASEIGRERPMWIIALIWGQGTFKSIVIINHRPP